MYANELKAATKRWSINFIVTRVPFVINFEHLGSDVGVAQVGDLSPPCGPRKNSRTTRGKPQRFHFYLLGAGLWLEE